MGVGVGVGQGRGSGGRGRGRNIGAGALVCAVYQCVTRTSVIWCASSRVTRAGCACTQARNDAYGAARTGARREQSVGSEEQVKSKGGAAKMHRARPTKENT